LLFGVVGFSLDVERGKSGLGGLVIGGLLGPFGLYFMIYSEFGQSRKLYLSITNILVVLIISNWFYQTITKDTKDKSDEMVLVDSSFYDNTSLETKKSPEFLLNRKITKLENELKKFDTTFDNSQYRGSIESIYQELNLFNNWSKLIEENEGDTSEVVQKLNKKLKSKVISLQTKEFPLMRKEFCKCLDRELWKNEQDVLCLGSKNTTIRLIGGTYVLRSNILNTQNQIYSDLEFMRFKKSEYKWFEYDDSYTYYTINSLKDGEIKYSSNLNDVITTVY